MKTLEVITEPNQVAMINNVDISNDAWASAYEFQQKGMREYEHLIIGEEKAKFMFLAGLALGDKNIVVAGVPGGGKSSLLGEAYRIVDGINPEHVASVPHRADLTPAQLVGDSTKAVKETRHEDGSMTREEIGAIVQAILTSDMKVVNLDEITRGNPYTLNAILGLLAKRTMTVNGDNKKFDNIELVAAALNPEESLSSSFRAGAALASRFAMGAQLGNNTTKEVDHVLDEIWDNAWEPAPEKVQKVITLSGLHAVRASIPKVIINEELSPRAKEASKRLARELAMSDKPSKEAIGRLSTDLRDVTKAVALLRGNVVATNLDLYDAVEYRATGAMTMRGGNSTDIENVMSKVYPQ